MAEQADAELELLQKLITAASTFSKVLTILQSCLHDGPSLGIIERTCNDNAYAQAEILLEAPYCTPSHHLSMSCQLFGRHLTLQLLVQGIERLMEQLGWPARLLCSPDGSDDERDGQLFVLTEGVL
jgi:hypothetical protein